MILLNNTNNESFMDENDIRKIDNKLTMFSNMYNIGDHGENIYSIPIYRDDEGDMILQIGIKSGTGYNVSINLAFIEIEKSDYSYRENASIYRAFKKLEKYRTALLEAIDEAISDKSKFGTCIITIGDPDLEAENYNIKTSYVDGTTEKK